MSKYGLNMLLNQLHNVPPIDLRRRSHLRLARPSDGPFIYRLRSDPNLSRFLNAPPTTLHEQIAWLKRYKCDESIDKQYYFIIVSKNQDRGTVRMYDFQTINGLQSFCWGSWIIAPPPVVGLASYSALAIYQLGFEHLGFEHAHFDVRRANKNVVAFHLRSGAQIVREDDQDFFFHFTRKSYIEFKRSQYQTIERHSAFIQD